MTAALVIIAISFLGIAVARSWWPRWEGPVEDSIREQEEEL
jgi:hypothetical protein